MNVEQILANIKWIKMTPENNPRLLDLADFDREYSTGTNDDCVRAIERIITGYLIPIYPKQLIGNANPYPVPDDCDTWSGLALLSCALADDLTEMIAMTLQMEMDLSPALFLHADSELTVHMMHRKYYMYGSDIYDATQLRIADRETLITGFSLQQLQGTTNYLETIIPMLMIKNV